MINLDMLCLSCGMKLMIISEALVGDFLLFCMKLCNVTKAGTKQGS